MANANPSKSSESNAASEAPKQPGVKSITKRSEIKDDSEAKFKVLAEGSDTNPNYRKYELPDGTIKEVR